MPDLLVLLCKYYLIYTLKYENQYTKDARPSSQKHNDFKK